MSVADCPKRCWRSSFNRTDYGRWHRLGRAFARANVTFMEQPWSETATKLGVCIARVVSQANMANSHECSMARPLRWNLRPYRPRIDHLSWSHPSRLPYRFLFKKHVSISATKPRSSSKRLPTRNICVCSQLPRSKEDPVSLVASARYISLSHYSNSYQIGLKSTVAQYDNALALSCQTVLNCISLTPGLFHDYKAAGSPEKHSSSSPHLEKETPHELFSKESRSLTRRERILTKNLRT